MKKIFYLVLTIFCLACEDPPHAPEIKGLKTLGSIDAYHKVVVYHDDDRSTTCYIIAPYFDSQSYSISCVKDEMAPPK